MSDGGAGCPFIVAICWSVLQSDSEPQTAPDGAIWTTVWDVTAPLDETVRSRLMSQMWCAWYYCNKCSTLTSCWCFMEEISYGIWSVCLTLGVLHHTSLNHETFRSSLVIKIGCFSLIRFNLLRRFFICSQIIKEQSFAALTLWFSLLLSCSLVIAVNHSFATSQLFLLRLHNTVMHLCVELVQLEFRSPCSLDFLFYFVISVLVFLCCCSCDYSACFTCVDLTTCVSFACVFPV